MMLQLQTLFVCMPHNVQHKVQDVSADWTSNLESGSVLVGLCC